MISAEDLALGYAAKALVQIKGSRVKIKGDTVIIDTPEGTHYFHTEDYRPELTNHLIDMIYPAIK